MMRCQNCGGENPEDKKSCGDCGAALPNRCARCGSDNPTGKQYCGDCGAPLVTAPLAFAAASLTKPPAARPITVAPDTELLAGERKTVSAFFADIKGSMELIQELDAEEARATVDPVLKLMIDAVHRYDGHVVQSTGDGVFAMFGAPIAHEDHPQRALYAALRLQDELKRYSHKLRAEGRMPLQARVGVNTGEVVVRSIRTDEAHIEYTPIGHSISLAARMQTLAPIGSIAVPVLVRKTCEGYFTFKSLGPTVIKGVTEPVEICEVTGLGPLRTRFEAAAQRGLSKFVGRNAELQHIKHALELARDGHGQIVAAIGEPGVGKSRLFHEFKAGAQSSVLMLEAYSISHGKASAYLPLIELLYDYFRILPEDSARLRREKVAGKIVILDRALEDTLPYLYALLGIAEGEDPLALMDTQIRRRRTHDALKRVLLRESLNQPLTLMFEDLHWIDDETQQFLNLLAEALANARIMLLVNYRPEYRHEWGNRSCYTQLRLDPLGKESAEEMLAELIGDASELAPLKGVIAERTQGNPFFIEEIVLSLFDDGTLVRNGTVRLTRSFSGARIPPSVQAVLAARIDRLASEHKELLQTLSVIGREFSRALVCRVAVKGEEEVDRLLEHLRLAEFIYEQPAAGEAEYIFKHALTQEVAYNSVLTERRKLTHERTAQAIESLHADSIDDHLAGLAYHYSRSANVQKAVDYLRRAGRQAIQRSAYTSAMDYLRTALGLLTALPAGAQRDRQELDLQLAIGASNSVAGSYGSPVAIGAFERAFELCRGDESKGELFEVLVGLLLNNLPRDLAKPRELGERLVAIAQRSGDADRLAQAYMLLGNALLWQAEFELAVEIFERCTSLAEAQGPASAMYGDSKTIALGLSGWALWFLGHPDRALTSVRAAVERARRIGVPLALGWVLSSLAVVHYLRGEAAAARDAAAEGITVAYRHGFMFQSTFTSVVHGWARVNLADLGGLEDIQASLSTYASVGTVPTNLIVAAAATSFAEAGQYQQALLLLTQSPLHGNDPMCKAELLRLEGEFRSALDEAAQPETCYRKAIEVARGQKAKSWELRAMMSLARSLAKQGRREEAHIMLADIYNWFTEGFDTADLKEARELLQKLSAT
jgi:class 3 adenylate cyclase/tetratricopeptide (TPR) repeat protein